jgi:predicted nicotinamide N-methyase
MFFDDYPRFYTTSNTTPYPGRLNLRYEAIFTENRDIFAGARVLDIASHDGRWSLAAIKSGAAHVLGIEARESLATEAESNLHMYGIEPDRYRFVTGDIFEVLARDRPQVDVVLCLGFLYHTLRYNELLSLIRSLNPAHVIIDTAIASTQRAPVIQIRLERSDRESNAVRDAYSYGNRVLSGKPSFTGLQRMLRAYGFKVERVSDWSGLLRDNPRMGGATDYKFGERITVRCRSRVPVRDRAAGPAVLDADVEQR